MKQATDRVRHLGSDRLRLRGFHDDPELLWIKGYPMLPADDRIGMLTQAKITPVVTFIVKCRPLKENLEHQALRTRRIFLRVVTLPQL